MSHANRSVTPPVAGRRPPATVYALLNLMYAVAAYVFFLGVLAYSVGSFTGRGVPKGIDQETPAAALLAVAIDVLLLLLFAVQHTVMARPWFKRGPHRASAGRADFVRVVREPGTGAAATGCRCRVNVSDGELTTPPLVGRSFLGS